MFTRLRGIVESMNFSAQAATFAVIGDPVGHSLSPLIHNMSFQSLSSDAVYVAHEVPSERLADAVRGMVSLGYRGFNVTMPHKTHVIEYLDSMSDVARVMNAVNTVTITDGKLHGDNTDGGGMLRAIRVACGDISDASLAVIGAGGTGSAIVTQAALDGVRHITHLNRAGTRLDDAKRRATQLQGISANAIDVVDLTDRDATAESIRSADIIIDATNVGMGELAGKSNIESGWLREDHIVADTVYHPRETRLLQQARDAGAQPIFGSAMLIHQAALAEAIWLGVDMPVNVVTKALLDR